MVLIFYISIIIIFLTFSFLCFASYVMSKKNKELEKWENTGLLFTSVFSLICTVALIVLLVFS